MSILFFLILISCSWSCQLVNSRATATLSDTTVMINTDTNTNLQFNLAYRIAWDDQDFPKCTQAVFPISSLSSNSSPNRNQIQAPKQLLTYPDLEQPYVYDPTLNTIHQVNSNSSIDLVADLKKTLPTGGQVADLLISSNMAIYLLSYTKKGEQVISTLQRVDVTGQVTLQLQHQQAINTLRRDESGGFYQQLVWFQQHLYVLAKDQSGTTLYRLERSEEPKLAPVYRSEQLVRSIQAGEEQLVLVNEQDEAIWLNPNTGEQILDRQYPVAHRNVIGIDNIDHLYAYDDFLSCIEKDQGIVQQYPLFNIMPLGSDIYYQKGLALVDVGANKAVVQVQQQGGQAESFSFGLDLIPDYASIRLVNLTETKAYFAAGDYLNEQLYIVDRASNKLTDVHPYQPLQLANHYQTEAQYNYWAVESDGSLLIPVQGADALYIFRCKREE